MSKYVIVVSGASSGFGALTVRALSQAGHTVYAGMRDIQGESAKAAKEAREFADRTAGKLLPVDLDVTSDESVQAAIAKIENDQGRLDILIHNAGHMTFGPLEAFTPEQLMEIYDVNAIGTQRLNRAAVPILRKQGQGYLVWVGSSSTRGGKPPYLGPYFAAKAAMDALAESYANELSRWGIETTIIVPGAFQKGTNHFAHAGTPADKRVAQEYSDGPYKGVEDRIREGLASLEPADADVGLVAEAIARVVELPFGTRPFRVHVDPSNDGAEIVNGVADRMRVELLEKIGLGDLLKPAEQPVRANRTPGS